MGQARRWIALTLLPALLGFALAGCGPNPGPTQAGKPLPSDLQMDPGSSGAKGGPKTTSAQTGRPSVQ